MADLPALDYSRLPAFGTSVKDEREKRKPGWLGAGLSSGIDVLQSLGGSTLQGAGKAFGLQPLESFGRDIAERNIAESIANGRPDLEVAPWREGGASVLPWLGYQSAKQVPLIATYLLGGKAFSKLGGRAPAELERLGAVVPRALGGGGVRQGASFTARRAGAEAGKDFATQLVGGAIAGIPLGFGSMIQEADQKPGGVTTQDVLQAAALSPIYSALDAVQPAALKGLFKHGQAGNIVRRVATAGFAGAAAEVPQEGLQTAMEQSFRPDLSLQEKMTNIVDAAVTGGAVGGVFGGIGGVRRMKRADPASVTESDLGAVVDEVLGLPSPQSLSGAIPAPNTTVGVNPAGEASVTAPTIDFGTQERRDTVSYKAGEPATPQRPYQDISTEELQVGLGAAARAIKAGDPSEGVVRFVEAAHDELRRRNIPLSTDAVNEVPVGAVELDPSRRRGTGAQTTEVPAPASQAWPVERDTLLKGIATRKWYREAESQEELDTILRARLENGSTAKSDFELAKRRGIDTNAPAAMVEAAATRVPDQVQKAAVADDEFQARWKQDVRETGQRDPAVRALKPTNAADAQVKLYRALGTEGVKSDRDGVERLAQKYGVLDENLQLTPLAVEIAKKDPIPTETAVKAAVAQGYKGAAASLFDRGVRAYLGGKPVEKFKNKDDFSAYMAGARWAEEHNSVPKVASNYWTAGVARSQPGGEATAQPGRISVPEGQKRQQVLNRTLDSLLARGELTEDEAVPIRRLVAQGEVSVDEAIRYTRSGRGALLTENPRRKPYRGETVERGGMAERAISNARTRRAHLRIEQEIQSEKQARESAELIARHKAREAIKARLLELEAEVDEELAVEAGAPSELEVDERGVLRNAYQIDSSGARQLSIDDKIAASKLIGLAIESASIYADGRFYADPRVVLDAIIEMGGELGAMAKRFRPFVTDQFKIRILRPEEMDRTARAYSDGDLVEGMVEHGSGTIYISTKVAHPSIILHEIMHTIADRHIFMKTAIGREIISIFNRFKRYGPKNDYAFTNAYEFMAEFLSRKQVRDYIQQFNEQGKVGNIFRRMWDAIRRAVGNPARTSVEYILELAEAAGRNPLGDLGEQLASPMITNDRVKQVTSLLDQATSTYLSRNTVVGKTLKAMIGWMPLTHIVKQYKTIFPETSLLFDAHADRRATTAVLAHLFDTTKLISDKLKGSEAGKKAIERTHYIMEATAWDIDPSRPWSDQKHLHGSDNEETLKRLHAEFHRVYNLLKKDGQDQLYDAYRQINEMEHYAGMAMGLREMVSNDPTLMAAMPVFETDPMRTLRNDSSLHNPVAAQRHWRDQLDTYVKAVTDYFTDLRGAGDNKEVGRLSPLETYLGLVKTGLQTMQNAPYFHLGRHGQQFVSARLKLGDDKKLDSKAVEHVARELEKLGITNARISSDLDKPVIFLRVETISQRDQIADLFLQLEDQGWLDKGDGENVKRGSRDEGEWLPERTKNEMKKFITAMEARFGETDDMSDAEKEAAKNLRARVRSVAFDVWLNMLPDAASSKVMTHRESKPGYDKDMGRNFAWRYNIGVNSLASMASQPYIDEAFTKMRERLYSSKVARLGQDVDSITTIYGELALREEQLAQIAGDDTFDKWRAMTHAYFLGASPSYFLINMTQLGVLLWPELAKKHGYVNAAKAMAKVTSLALNIMSETIRQGYAAGGVLRSADMIITPSVLQKVAGKDKDLLNFLQHIVGSGLIDIGSSARELGTIAEGRANIPTQNVLRFAAAAGLWSETSSRLIAALAARELHKGDFESTTAYAKDVVRESMLEYSTYNTARQMGKMGLVGRFTPVMTQFMQYSVQLTYKLYREMYAAFTQRRKGESERVFKGRQAEARKFLLAHLTAVTTLAGTLGLPFATAAVWALEKLVDFFGDDEDEPFDGSAAWRNWLAGVFGPEIGDMVARGVPRAGMEGFDLSQRAGEQNLLPFSRWLTDKRKWRDASSEAALRSLGAPVSMVSNIAEGFEKISDGDYLAGAQALVPIAIKGPIAAYQMSAEGYTDAQGNKLPLTPKSHAYLLQLLGLTPAVKAEYSEERGDQLARRTVLNQRAKVLRDGIVDAVLRGDDEAARDLIRKAQAFSQANPKFDVLSDIDAAIKRRAQLQAISMATRTPIGVAPDDEGARALTRYSPLEYEAQVR